MFKEANTKTNLPAQIDIYATKVPCHDLPLASGHTPGRPCSEGCLGAACVYSAHGKSTSS